MKPRQAPWETRSRALALYAWNAEVSAALLAPLHICEVVMRNAAAEAWRRCMALAGHGKPHSFLVCPTLPETSTALAVI